MSNKGKNCFSKTEKFHPLSVDFRFKSSIQQPPHGSPSMLDIPIPLIKIQAHSHIVEYFDYFVEVQNCNETGEKTNQTHAISDRSRDQYSQNMQGPKTKFP